MKRVLTKSRCNVWWVDNGVRGDLSGVYGKLTGVCGDLTGVRGDLSGVCGKLDGVYGDLSGVYGKLDGVYGDLDDCDLTDDDRRAGVDVADLIVQTPGGEE
jgi:hypothetical protein